MKTKAELLCDLLIKIIKYNFKIEPIHSYTQYDKDISFIYVNVVYENSDYKIDITAFNDVDVSISYCTNNPGIGIIHSKISELCDCKELRKWIFNLKYKDILL